MAKIKGKHHFTLVIDDDLRRALKADAAARGITPSASAREALRAYYLYYSEKDPVAYTAAYKALRDRVRAALRGDD